ncbi:hydroxypyruvate isomerase family protein [Mycobacterium sherrisii]|uniref:hydroxypyruvate isomerase family protein n=1 Tax=Mycobacterium sherrisii TaxID=243061 RepID=UPI000A1484CC|nr:TIM barrel protein [Mycobacterium sherrisii]MCV7028799.1 TIM barrel protein [Mycobacterium sherrisii]MEC4761791.1 TIM barrel protein [Mycobacterium sherrisii]ORW82658.1 hydroxypyruvate isomerase [Mycobacterium sherrisii]
MATATYTVNCSILFTDLPVLERPAAARAAGFEAVEFWWPFIEATPPEADVTAFIRAIEEAGVQLSGLNFFAGYMAGGDRGVLSDPALTTEFRDNVRVAVSIAEALGTQAFNALYGNRIEGVAPDVQDDVAAKNIAYAAQAAQRIGATVLIEPVSGAPLYPLKTAADAVGVIDRVNAEAGTTNLRLLADFYHLYVNNDDVVAAVQSHRDLIGHIQIADAPGRGEPGTGEIPLGEYFEVLGSEYGGYIGLEYKPSREDTFDWLPTSERGRGGFNVESLNTLTGTRNR